MTGLTCSTFTAKMMTLLNGQERTITYLRDPKEAGWKIIAVHHDPPAVIRFQKVIAVPDLSQVISEMSCHGPLCVCTALRN